MNILNQLNLKLLFLLIFYSTSHVLSIKSAEAASDQPRYRIEVVVFTSRADSTGTEKWPSWQAMAASGNNIQTEGMPEKVTRYITNSENSELSQLLGNLTENGEYVVLDYRAWYQQADTRSQSPAAYYESRYENIGTLKGQVQFYMSRFLHVNVNLKLVPDQYSPERTKINSLDNSVNEVASLQPVYIIEQGKRVKSEAYYYFDHPQFGAIVYVKPVETRG